jgi:DNA-binding transcriptional ArsR family regulator
MCYPSAHTRAPARVTAGQEGFLHMPQADDQPSDHAHPLDPDRVTKARARLISPADAQRLATLLGLLADPIRARIIYALDTVEELCVGDIALALQASEDATGYGLRILRTAGLLTTRREGRVVYYRLADNFPEPLREHCLRRLVDLSRTATDD